MSPFDDACERTTAGTPPAVTTVIDRLTSPAEIVDLIFKQRTLERQQAFVRTFSIDVPVAPSTLVSDHAVVDRCATHDSGVFVLARFENGSVLVKGFPRSTTVSIASSDENELDELEVSIRSRVTESATPGTAPIRTWHSNPHGNYRSSDRSIAAPAWNSIAANYAPPTRAELDRMMSITEPVDGGKLILWHGEPGTGKTTALRALMRSWEPWCASQYIADPERFFADPGYIGEVLTRPNKSSAGPTFSSARRPGATWRLVIAEDSDEYLRASARRDAGAGLGRLLNLADGVLGQGFNTLILLTTNEELNRIHPALTRPGRCLARIEFSRFSPTESREWLPPGCAIPEHEMTLAELYERAGIIGRIGDHQNGEQSIGQYI